MKTINQHVNASFEIFLDELMSDDELLRSFLRDPGRTIQTADEWALPLTDTELYSLRAACATLGDELTEQFVPLKLAAA